VKTCRTCGEEKPLHRFYDRKSAKDGKRAQCIACVHKTHPNWLSKKRETMCQAQRRWRCKHIYGIGLDEYEALVEAHAGRCRICHRQDDKLNVDHCHKELKVRGLLCGRCNRGLGLFRDNPDYLRNAANYLEGD
jgi:hypothetical protein